MGVSVTNKPENMEEIFKNLTTDQKALMMTAFMLGRAYEHTEHSKTASCYYNPDDENDAITMYEYFDSIHRNM